MYMMYNNLTEKSLSGSLTSQTCVAASYRFVVVFKIELPESAESSPEVKEPRGHRAKEPKEVHVSAKPKKMRHDEADD
jgi:hypothetical protein